MSLLWRRPRAEVLFYVLHIHSALSPCAEDEMTPHNVCAMAALKGLDLIALTDHNAAGNLRSFEEAALARGLMFLPGIEVTTAEEVHILTYFPTVDAAEAMGAWCREQLMGQRNKPEFFGTQRLFGSRDEPRGEEEALLIGALAADLGQVCKKARGLGGVPVPAHVFRSFGLMTVLGFFPAESGFLTAETKPGEQLPAGMVALHSSDAHTLGAIAEREHALPVSARTNQAVLGFLLDHKV